MQFESFQTYLLTEKRCSPHTLEAYKNDLEQFRAFCRQSYELDNPADVNTQVVRSWLASLLDEQYEVSSVHRKLSSLRAWYRFLMKTGVVAHNPVRGIPKPKKPKRLPVFVEESATRKMYKRPTEGLSHKEVRDQLMISLLYETGLRQSELLNLKDSDVDRSIGQLKVLGKRNKMRLVPLNNLIIKDIDNYQQIRATEVPQNETSHLFLTDKGKKITKNLLYVTVKNYLSQITTIKRKSPHVLRHTFATHMLNNGADLNVIKEILGHSSLAATQVYTHNSIDKLKRIHTAMHPRNNSY